MLLLLHKGSIRQNLCHPCTEQLHRLSRSCPRVSWCPHVARPGSQGVACPGSTGKVGGPPATAWGSMPKPHLTACVRIRDGPAVQSCWLVSCQCSETRALSNVIESAKQIRRCLCLLAASIFLYKTDGHSRDGILAPCERNDPDCKPCLHKSFSSAACMCACVCVHALVCVYVHV